jgi:membrane fusion protein (multidrug efflux system)
MQAKIGDAGFAQTGAGALLSPGVEPLDRVANGRPESIGATPAPLKPALRWAARFARVMLVIGAGVTAWTIARDWDRWTGASRYQTTDDAYLAGDLTPLSAKVSGYVARVLVNDYQAVRKGDIVVEIEPSDYRAELAQAEANLASAKTNLLDIGPQKAEQRALIRQAEANSQATAADMLRYHLEADRQRALLASRLAGTQQLVEQASANERRTKAQLVLNAAQLDQQKAELSSLDVHEEQLSDQVGAATAQRDLARNNLRYTQVDAPADGMVGQRQVRPGQFVNVGTELIAVMALPNIWVIANYKETQMTHVRAGQPVSVKVDAFPDLVLHGHVQSWSPGTGSTFALLAPDNATGNFTKVVQRMPVKIVLDANPALGALVRPGMSVEATIDTGETRSPVESRRGNNGQ